MTTSRPDLAPAFEPSPRLILFIFCALPLLLFWPSLIGGKLLFGSDTVSLGYPFSLAERSAIDAGSFPHWMPEIFGGMPGIGGTNLYFLYPTEFLGQILRVPVHLLPGIAAACALLLGSTGMAFLLRLWGASPSAALLSAFFYAGSGMQISAIFAGHANNVQAYGLLPWAFAGAALALRRRSWAGWALCGLALALMALAVAFQILAYVGLGLVAYIVWQQLESRQQDRPANGPGAGVAHETAMASDPAAAAPLSAAFCWGGLALAGLLALLLSAPQLLPSIEYKPYSWRQDFTYDAFTSWSFHPLAALTWWVPGAFGWGNETYFGDWDFCLTTEYLGLLPWVLAVAAMANFRSSSLTRFLTYFALGSFLIALGKHTPLHQIFYQLPVYNGFRSWVRFLCLFSFALCALAGLGWDRLRQDDRARAWTLYASASLASIGLLSLLVSSSRASQAAQALGQKLGGLEAATARLLPLLQASALQCLFIASALGAAAWALKRSPTLGQSALALALLLGLHSIDQRAVWSRYIAFQSLHDVQQSAEGLSLLPKATEPFRVLGIEGAFAHPNVPLMAKLENAQGYHGLLMDGPRKLAQAMGDRQQDWIDLMNVRYVISRQPMNFSGWTQVLQGGLNAYENPRRLPRAFLVGKAEPVADPAAAFARLADLNFDVHQQMLWEGGPLFQGSASGSIAWLDYRPGFLRLSVNSASPAALLISNNWYPSWKAFVDGASTPLYRADGSLQALQVPSGQHEVRLEFVPKAFYLGLVLALLGSLVTALLFWRGWDRIRP